MRCKECGIEIDETNKATREKGKWRKECRKCWSKKHNIWSSNNREKRRVVQRRYDRKQGIGIDYPCEYCQKMCKRHSSPHYCSDKCRFLAKVDKKDCWEWTSQVTNGGYGKYSFKGTTVLAHRYAYETFIGKIPKGLQVCHTCDNRRCVNPKHLWFGTAKDNAQDSVRKGRKASGERNGSAKLKEKEIHEIRKMHKKGCSQTEIAKKYSCTQALISKIVNNKLWKTYNPKERLI